MMGACAFLRYWLGKELWSSVLVGALIPEAPWDAPALQNVFGKGHCPRAWNTFKLSSCLSQGEWKTWIGYNVMLILGLQLSICSPTSMNCSSWKGTQLQGYCCIGTGDLPNVEFVWNAVPDTLLDLDQGDTLVLKFPSNRETGDDMFVLKDFPWIFAVVLCMPTAWSLGRI